MKFILPFILLCIVFCSPVRANASDRIAELEKRIADLEKESGGFDEELQRLFSLTKSINEGVKVSGFLTTAASMVDTDDNVQWGNNGPDDELDWNADSIVGLQVAFKLSEDLQAVTQLVSKGGFTSNFDADWFYLKYQYNDDVDILLGRVRPQFFMLSDYLKVGFAYPWIRPPVEVYDPIPTDVAQGVSVNYRHRFNEFRVSSHLQVMQSEDQGTVSQFDAQMIIAAIEISYDDWSLGLRKSNMKVDILLQNDVFRMGSASLERVSRELSVLPAENAEVESGNISLRYDDGRWLMLSEIAYFDLEGLFVDTESFYGTLGYRFGNWLPHFTFSKLYSTDDSLRASSEIALHKLGLPAGSDEQIAVATVEALGPLLWNQKSTAYTLGVNYFFTPQIVGKIEAKLVKNRKGTVAHFQNANTSAEVIPVIPADDDIYIYGLAVDVIF